MTSFETSFSFASRTSTEARRKSFAFFNRSYADLVRLYVGSIRRPDQHEYEVVYGRAEENAPFQVQRIIWPPFISKHRTVTTVSSLTRDPDEIDKVSVLLSPGLDKIDHLS